MALHLVPDILFVGFAAFTASPVFAVFPSILRAELVTVLAVCFCAISGTICCATQSKTRFVNLFFWQKNFLNWPAEVYTLINGLMRDSKFSCPLHRGLSFAVKLKKAINSSVAHLVSAASPSAIRRLVISIIVNSIYGHAFRRVPHIIKKIRQIIAPSIANLYATPAVIFVSMIVWIKAALLNAMPNCFNPSSAKPVSGVSLVNFSKMSRLFFSNHNNSPLGAYNIQREWSQS